MNSESEIDNSPPQLVDAEAGKNELRMLYANELGGNMHYADEDSPRRVGDRLRQTCSRPEGMAYDSHESPENRSYDRWKTQNRLFAGGQNRVDMVSGLGKKLESGRLVVQNREAEALRAWSYGDETGADVYSTPPTDRHYYRTTNDPAARSPNFFPSSGKPGTGHRWRSHDVPLNGTYYSPEHGRCSDEYERNLHITHGFDSRHCYNSPVPVPRPGPDACCSARIRKCGCDPANKPQHSPRHKAKADRTSKKSEMSLKRLYRIVWLQNEQLALLQKQINKLTVGLGRIEECQKTELPKPPIIVEKASVGVMTSFVNLDRGMVKKPDFNLDNAPDKLTDRRESTSEESKRRPDGGNNDVRINREESFTLHGIEIPDHIPSPQASMHLDINEYKSDSSSSDSLSEDNSSDSSDGEEEVNLPPVGWTFYDSVVGQVNNMLTKSDDQTQNESESGLDDVRNATFDQLRRLGVSFMADPDNQAHKRVTFNQMYCPKANVPSQQKSIHTDSDTSMHINALAMKYLKGVQSPLGKSDKVQGMAFCNVANGGNNLSFATLRYLERYQLVPASGKQNEAPRSSKDAVVEDVVKLKKSRAKKADRLKGGLSDRTNREIQPPSSKILDITAIKQQPKLLPKKFKNL